MQNILALYGQRGAAKTALRGKTYLKNAALLTVAGFALRALGMVFRVFVAARLGPEGMGLYQLILSVYMVFVSLASAGINVASTRLGAQCLTRGRGMAPTLRSLAATAAVLGTAAMLAQLALADPLARFALHDSRAELGLCTLAPSLPFIAAAWGAAGVLFGAAKGGTEYHCPTGGADRADGRGRIGAGKAGPLGRGLRLLCGAHRQYCQ